MRDPSKFPSTDLLALSLIRTESMHQLRICIANFLCIHTCEEQRGKDRASRFYRVSYYSIHHRVDNFATSAARSLKGSM